MPNGWFCCQTDELLPSKLERCTDPLEQAIRFLVPLQTLASDNIQSHIFAYEIYSRKGERHMTIAAVNVIVTILECAFSHVQGHTTPITFIDSNWVIVVTIYGWKEVH